MTVFSVIVSSLSLAFTSWRLHQRELNQLRCLEYFDKVESSSVRAFVSFQGWFSTEILISVISTVALCMMTWIELFSGELLTEQVGLGVVKTNVHIIANIILLSRKRVVILNNIIVTKFCNIFVTSAVLPSFIIVVIRYDRT